MTGLFSILFLAAFVGVFKPYIKGTKRWHFGLAAFIFLLLVGAFVDPNKKENTEGTVAGVIQGEGAVKVVPASEAKKAQELESEWSYSTEKDEMRGVESRFAQLEAVNAIHLDFPYGEQRGQLLVRQSAKHGFDILVGVPSGQILCNSFQDTFINVKFDDGPIQRYGCSDASDGTNNMVFIQGSKNFLGKLKKSKKLIVEMEFYQNGVQQMTFNIANLKWGN